MNGCGPPPGLPRDPLPREVVPVASTRRARSVAAVACGFLVILGVPVAHAQTYKVQVYADVGELDMKIEPIPHDDVLVVRLTNHSPGRVRCDLLYDAAPQTPSRKTTYIDAGKTEESSLRAQREWFRVNVKATCRAVAPR